MRLSLAVLMAASAGLAPRAQDVPAPAAATNSYAAVAPILDRCAECHGAQRQRKGLRVDAREALLLGGRSGPAVVPGKAAESILLQRVSGIGKRMPPTGAALTATEIGALRAWIDGGAPMPERPAVDPRPWAHRPVTLPPVPAIAGAAHPIDAFVRARVRELGSAADLTPQSPETRTKLLRRASLDLIGLPPSVATQDALLADTAPDAYARAVDRLLESPQFGERWAALWLDLARYADTKGYEKDDRRSIWRYRDWVIDAFNRDLPFDQFTIKQLAGDLLPNATPDDLIATAFHRNTMTNDEGGTDNEEFRVAAVVDRVNTTMSVWMGTTLGCCQCHDHKSFWRRTSPYPSMLAFDAPSREFCVVKRVPTNTPLQALVTLNDPVFVEAAEAFAARMQREGGTDLAARLVWGFRACTGRHPAPAERQRLLALYLGEAERGDAVRAYRVLANVLLNLDETLTKG